MREDVCFVLFVYVLISKDPPPPGTWVTSVYLRHFMICCDGDDVTPILIVNVDGL